MVSVVIHTNLHLANQIESAEWLRQGFAAHGIDAEITADRQKRGDVQVVQGPWYALDYWTPRSADHPVLWLDRCFYGDARFDLSIGWLRPDGSRDFVNDGAAGEKGLLPQLQPAKQARRSAVVFGDYGRDHAEDIYEARKRFDAVYYRPHPQDGSGVPKAMSLSGDLAAVFALGDVALGHSSTVLVQAAIEGLAVESTDPRHVVQQLNGSRERWLAWLSWAQWSHSEIMAGDAWEHLREGIDRIHH